MTEIPQSQCELEEHLQEQLRFIEASADAYDGGFEGEAKRLAVTLRLLLHDTGRSQSLLSQLDYKNVKFYDSAIPFDPENLLTYAGLVVTELTGSTARFRPMLDSDQPVPARPAAFGDWWSGIVFVDVQRGRFTRRDLVLSVADTDGGAHVDPRLSKAYAELSRGNALGWTSGTSTETHMPLRAPHLAAVRQIAHEVLKTFRPDYVKKVQRSPSSIIIAGSSLTVGGGAAAPTIRDAARVEPPRQVARRPGRNQPCPCGSGKKFKRCHGQ